MVGVCDPPPTSRTGGLARVPFGLLGCDLAECRVDALRIVVAFDVGEQVASGLVPGRPSSLVNEFDLESMEEGKRYFQAMALRAGMAG